MATFPGPLRRTTQSPDQSFSLLPSFGVRSMQTRAIAGRRAIARYHPTEIAFLLPLLLIARFAGINHQSLWYDEGYTLTLASASSFHQFWIRFGAFTTSEHLQPLYYFFMFFWSRAMGTSDLALRAPSALFSAGSAIAAYCAISPLAGSRRRLPVLFALALTLSSFSLYYGQEARPYALLQFLSFTLLAVWMQCRTSLAQKGSVSGTMKVLLPLVCALCMLCSPFVALLAFSLMASDFIMLKGTTSSGRKVWWQLWSASIAAAACALTTYLAGALSTMPGFIARDVVSIKQPLWMNIAYTIYGTFFGATLPPSTAALREPGKLHIALAAWPVVVPCALAAIALIMGAWLLVKNAAYLTEEVTSTLLSAGIYASIFILFFGFLGHLNILPRHGSALFAILFLQAALCANLLRTTRSTPALLLFCAGFAGWMLMNAVSIYNYDFNQAFRKDDYRATARMLQGTNVPIFLAGGQAQLLKRYGSPDMVDATLIEPMALAEFIRHHSNGAPVVEVVMNDYRNYLWDKGGSVVAAMALEYDCKTQRHLTNFDVYSCAYRSSGEQEAHSGQGYATQNGFVASSSTGGAAFSGVPPRMGKDRDVR